MKPMNKEEWLFCHVFKNKTRIKLRQDKTLLSFPLFCPKCKQETLLISIIIFLILGSLEIINDTRLIVLYLGGRVVFRYIIGIIIYKRLKKY